VKKGSDAKLQNSAAASSVIDGEFCRCRPFVFRCCDGSDTVQSAAAAEIAVHSVSPSRASSAPGNELVAGASTVSEVMEMPTNSTMQASEVFEAIAPQDPPTDQVVSQNKL